MTACNETSPEVEEAENRLETPSLPFGNPLSVGEGAPQTCPHFKGGDSRNIGTEEGKSTSGVAPDSSLTLTTQSSPAS